MVVKVLYYVLSVFVIVVFSLLAQEPYLLDSYEGSFGFANIEMEDVRDFDMNEKAVLRVFEANKALRYQDKDVLKLINMKVYEKGFIYNIKSDEALYKEGSIELKGNVFISRSDKMYIKTQMMNYDVHLKRLSSKLPFSYGSEFLISSGKDFVYDLKKKQMKINNIKAIYRMENN